MTRAKYRQTGSKTWSLDVKIYTMLLICVDQNVNKYIKTINTLIKKEFAMAIVSKTVYTRTDSSKPFITEANPSERQAYLAAYGDLAGTGIINEPAVVDNTLTITITCDSLESLSVEDTAGGLQYNNVVTDYLVANGIEFDGYTQTGIDSPFTMTTVYTAPSAGIDYFTTFQNILTNKNTKMTSLSATDTTITTVHTFDNSADFTEHYQVAGFVDHPHVKDLFTNGFTRTVTYAAV